MVGLLEPGHLIIILLIALLVFGPRKLPELGKSLGETLREFRKHTSGAAEEVRRGLEAPQTVHSTVVPEQPAPQVVVRTETATERPAVRE